MKALLITLVLFFNAANKNCDVLFKVRNIFQAGVNEKELDNMLAICNKAACVKITPYHAAATMKKAEFAWSPIKKISYFNTGKRMLDDFINQYPHNIEARYVRWLTQKMAPSFLGYNKNLEDDYNYIINNIERSDIDIDYKKTILEHIKKVAHE